LPILPKLSNPNRVSLDKSTVKYVFLVTGFNCARWVIKCAKSILDQQKTHWICILCDDGSTDNTLEKINKFASNNTNFYTYHNIKNMGACHTRYYAIQKYKHLLNDEDVILLIGGDDYLAHNKVLNILDKAYAKGAQVTYGNWKDLYGLAHQLHVIPDNVLAARSYRKYKWVTTAINTFKYYLFKQVPISEYIEPGDKWIRNCTDLAVMFPVLELADPKRIIPIKEVIYVYNSRYAHNTIARFGLKDKGRLNRIIRAKQPLFLNPY
jgi:glycosyltransferase involved in cell wall biosynthesis